jgi:hypothetical protein
MAALMSHGHGMMWASDVRKMPLRNRVNPFGAIFETQARGTMMGNRGGALHNQDREIVRDYKSRRWIACVLEFRGRYRIVMSPNRYTELFFLDEAVAFAAGHRPCAECRHESYKAFQRAWQDAYRLSEPPYADEMDVELHRARIGNRKEKVTYDAPLRSLPDGCFVQVEGCPYLVWDKALVFWTAEGYTKRESRPGDLVVTVLTPQPIVECFRQGYKPQVHDSLTD